jgi:hypothetical protein
MSQHQIPYSFLHTCIIKAALHMAKAVNARLQMTIRRDTPWLGRVVLALAVLAVCAGSSVAQTITVTRNVNLRLDSSTDQAPVRLLKPPTELELLQPEEEDGFYNVRTAEGQEGWVWAKNVRVDEAAPGLLALAANPIATEISEDWDKPTPNKSSAVARYLGFSDGSRLGLWRRGEGTRCVLGILFDEVIVDAGDTDL